MMLLQATGLNRRFGGVRAVQDINLDIAEGGISAVIGPNGAGKSTLFNLMTGLDRIDSGRVVFAGKVISGMPAHRINRLGIARTFQNIRLFREMSVEENILVGCHAHNASPWRLLRGLESLVRVRHEQKLLREKAARWLEFFRLSDMRSEQAGSLPYGKQRELEIARALAGEPRLLFLDEPAAGMNPQETRELEANIQRIVEQGVTVVLIEHDMKLVMSVSQRVMVMNFGQKVAEGSPLQVRRDPEVIRAYLGDETC